MAAEEVLEAPAQPDIPPVASFPGETAVDGADAGLASATGGQTVAEPVAAKQAKAPKPPKEAGKADAAGTVEVEGPSIAAHPRASRAVTRAKGWGGLLGFVIAGYASLSTNTLAGAGLRALIAGVVCYVVVWAGAVFVWRRLVMLELKTREQQLASELSAHVRRELPAPAGEGASGGARA
jgi:hypothetical protein